MKRIFLLIIISILLIIVALVLIFSFKSNKNNPSIPIENNDYLFLKERVKNYKIAITTLNSKTDEATEQLYNVNVSQKNYNIQENNIIKTKTLENDFYASLVQLVKETWKNRTERIKETSINIIKKLIKEYEIPFSFQENPTCYIELNEQYLNAIICDNNSSSLKFEFFNINEIEDFNNFEY